MQVKPNIKEFQGSSVVFDDGSVEHDIDLVVFATGYSFSFPFLPPHVLSVSENKTPLYKYIYPPGLEHPTLAVIGLIQPLGAIMPISEMQARWATRVFKGSHYKISFIWKFVCVVIQFSYSAAKSVVAVFSMLQQ